MRTTIKLEPDTAAAVDQLRREQGLGVSVAVNELVRRGLRPPRGVQPFVQRTSAGNARLDVTDAAVALELLDGPSHT